ncbi:MAG: FliH/SctL family protein [Terracidiphilus sp.]
MNTADGGRGCAEPDSAPGAPDTSPVEEARLSYEAGREQGIREGRESEKNDQGAGLQEIDRKRMEQVAELGNRLAGERDQFLRTVEQEVVRLALAIAARILRREAQTDPLFLVGAVRVALGQLAATMQVRLCVPAEESALWAKTLAYIPNLKVKPTVVPDDCMRPGDCTIETEMGSVDLSLGAQLHHMETALLDGGLAAKSGAGGDTLPEEQEGEL